jgi:hypothetical protein
VRVRVCARAGLFFEAACLWCSLRELSNSTIHLSGSAPHTLLLLPLLTLMLTAASQCTPRSQTWCTSSWVSRAELCLMQFIAGMQPPELTNRC